LYIPKGKIGSKHYLMIRMKEELNPLSIVRGQKVVKNEHPMLIIDVL